MVSKGVNSGVKRSLQTRLFGSPVPKFGELQLPPSFQVCVVVHHLTLCPGQAADLGGEGRVKRSLKECGQQLKHNSWPL